jgi:sugar fermentation stimulation protein A
MQLIGPLIRGRFIERPNRFLTLVKIGNKTVQSHLPDPGRLIELLIPGAEVYVRKTPLKSSRKTKYSTILVVHNEEIISLDSILPNRFIADLLEKKRLPFYKQFVDIEKEVVIGSHRIDFRITDKRGKNLYLEVKSVTYAKDGVARFPDAVTKRGTSHVKLLQELVKKGQQADILFVCQRSDPVVFTPFWERDPDFTEALQCAQMAGVNVRCITAKLTVEAMSYYGEIPVNFGP